jgi:hypothetical protein
MKLDARDIGYIASGRIQAKNRKQTNLWLIISAIGLGGAILLGRYNQNYGIVLAVVSFGAFYFYQNNLDKVQKRETARLFKEWQQEGK